MLARVSTTPRRSVDFSGDPALLGTSRIQDVEAIREHIARDSTRYADLVVERLVAAVQRLADHPRSGRVVPELGDDSIREVIYGNYRIVYRLQHDLIEIATVFQGARLFRLD
jgi:plasmid stabilization system protein ParE